MPYLTLTAILIGKQYRAVEKEADSAQFNVAETMQNLMSEYTKIQVLWQPEVASDENNSDKFLFNAKAFQTIMLGFFVCLFLLDWSKECEKGQYISVPAMTWK